MLIFQHNPQSTTTLNRDQSECASRATTQVSATARSPTLILASRALDTPHSSLCSAQRLSQSHLVAFGLVSQLTIEPYPYIVPAPAPVPAPVPDRYRRTASPARAGALQLFYVVEAKKLTPHKRRCPPFPEMTHSAWCHSLGQSQEPGAADAGGSSLHFAGESREHSTRRHSLL